MLLGSVWSFKLHGSKSSGTSSVEYFLHVQKPNYLLHMNFHICNSSESSCIFSLVDVVGGVEEREGEPILHVYT